MVKIEFSQDGVGYQTIMVTRQPENVFEIIDAYYGPDKPRYTKVWKHKVRQSLSEHQVLKSIISMESTDGRK